MVEQFPPPSLSQGHCIRSVVVCRLVQALAQAMFTAPHAETHSPPLILPFCKCKNYLQNRLHQLITRCEKSECVVCDWSITGTTSAPMDNSPWWYTPTTLAIFEAVDALTIICAPSTSSLLFNRTTSPTPIKCTHTPIIPGFSIPQDSTTQTKLYILNCITTASASDTMHTACFSNLYTTFEQPNQSTMPLKEIAENRMAGKYLKLPPLLSKHANYRACYQSQRWYMALAESNHNLGVKKGTRFVGSEVIWNKAWFLPRTATYFVVIFMYVTTNLPC